MRRNRANKGSPPKHHDKRLWWLDENTAMRRAVLGGKVRIDKHLPPDRPPIVSIDDQLETAEL